MSSLELPALADALIGAVLRGEDPAWPSPDGAALASVLLERSRFHGVAALLHSGLARSAWPAPLLSELRAQSIGAAMWELAHQQTLASLLAALRDAGVGAVLIKGTALAYSSYPDAALRTRGDTDLLIRPDTKDRAHRVLSALGFERQFGTSGEFVVYQASYASARPGTGTHTVDLHWRINNSELLSRLFSYEELRSEALPLPALCDHALRPSRVHELLLACMHRASHKQNPYFFDGRAQHDVNRLIWLYDIHLLAREMDAGEWLRFTRLAADKGLRAVCLEALHEARQRLASACPASAMAALAASGPPERAARYLNGSKLRQQWMDFRALDGASQQLQFLRELVLPAPAYMRQKYVDRPRAWLPWLYACRAATGVFRAASRTAVRSP